MTHELFMAGIGGQGILLIGNLLACAGMLEGRNVCYTPSYGVEKRGGAANCTVVVSDEEIGSPVLGHPGAGLLLHQAAFERFISCFRSGALVLINSDLVREGEPERDDLDLLRLPAGELARQLGDPRLLNMICLGAYAEASGAVALASLKAALEKVLPERSHRFIPLNSQAIDLGAMQVRCR